MIDKIKGAVIFEKILLGVVLVALVLTPVFFLPFTLSILDFNKQFLLYFLVALGLFVWLLTIMVKRVFVLHKTVLDIPIVVLWVLVGLSTLFSLNRQGSFFGTSLSFNYSFLLHTALTLFYFLMVQSLTSLARIKQGLLAVVIASWVGVLFYFIFGTGDGLTVGGMTLRFNPTSPLNSIFTLLLIPAWLLSLGNLFNKQRSMRQQIFWLITFLVMGFLILTSGFHSVSIAAFVGVVLMLVFAVMYAHQISYVWTSVTFGLVLVTGLLLFVNVPGALRAGFPAEIALGRTVSNTIVTQSMGSGVKNFLFGAGPSTFNQLFSLYRTSSFNAVERFWVLRFEKPISTVHHILAELGILNILVFALLIVMAVVCALPRLAGKRKQKENGGLGQDFYVMPAVFISFLTLTVGLFLNIFDTSAWFLWWVFLAFTVMLAQPKQNVFATSHQVPLSNAPQYSLLFSFFSVLVLVSFAAFGVYLGKVYAAEVAFNKVVQGADKTFEEQILLLDSAVKKRPAYYSYRLAAARLALGEAQRLSALPNPNAQRITQLFTFAVTEARTATTLAPTRVTTWQFLSLMYLYAQPFEPRANVLAIEALEKAIALEPTNPFFYNQIGNAYAFQNNGEKTIEYYEKAIELKPDFLPTYVNLATWHDAQGNLDNAITALERGLGAAGDELEYLVILSESYVRRGAGDDLERAKILADVVVQREANYARALMVLGRVAQERGERTAALQYYQQVLKENPNYEEALDRSRALQPSSAPSSESSS